jgi:cyclophilin family peptidyl-prolyl cis-trans isomerase
MTCFRFLSLAVICGGFSLLLLGCGRGDASSPAASIAAPAVAADDASSAASPASTTSDVGQPSTAPAKSQANNFPEVVLKTTLGDIRLRLNGEQAPLTVDNFLSNYARRGFYDGTIFHYVHSGEMVIAGGYTSDFEPKPTRAPIANEATNGLTHKRGTVAMIRDPQYAQSATSQFFINLKDNASFNHSGEETSEEFGYCVFGEVIAGMDVVDAIASAAVHDQGDFVNTPVTPVVIETVEQVK